MAGVHATIGAMRREMHWLLSEADAKIYGKALSDALRHTQIQVAQKTVDFMMLAICMFNFETPRVLLSYQLMQQKGTTRAASSPAAPTGTASIPFPNGPAAPAHPISEGMPMGAGGDGFVADGIDAPLGGIN